LCPTLKIDNDTVDRLGNETTTFIIEMLTAWLTYLLNSIRTGDVRFELS